MSSANQEEQQHDVAPVNSTRYLYFTNGRQLQRSTSVPIIFNEKAIGTTELPAYGSKSIHAVGEGHHFGQDHWCITDRNGGSWEHLPDIKSRGNAKESMETTTRPNIQPDATKASLHYTESHSHLPGESGVITPGDGIAKHILKGVNIGSWLIIEKWMSEDRPLPNSFAWTFDSSGSASALEKHWLEFYTEGDKKLLAAHGNGVLKNTSFSSIVTKF